MRDQGWWKPGSHVICDAFVLTQLCKHQESGLKLTGESAVLQQSRTFGKLYNPTKKNKSLWSRWLMHQCDRNPALRLNFSYKFECTCSQWQSRQPEALESTGTVDSEWSKCWVWSSTVATLVCQRSGEGQQYVLEHSKGVRVGSCTGWKNTNVDS